MQNIKFQIELSHGSLERDPFFMTQSPFPFAVSVGDEISGDALLGFQRALGADVKEDGLRVTAVRHYLFSSDGTTAARNIRLAVEPLESKGPSVYEARGLRSV